MLNRPDTMIFEDSERETLGGLNLGSVREVNGRKITVGGFTWGLIPFGPSYAFADYELARAVTRLMRPAELRPHQARARGHFDVVKKAVAERLSGSGCSRSPSFAARS